ncbi:apyrase-like [Athalia rosae]|uniref:apyrase-like n=1 Tax=Athalia rosae TaxID=37344 RepID=UPI002033560F|nr:apyrase-like [Athalia rosae]
MVRSGGIWFITLTAFLTVVISSSAEAADAGPIDVDSNNLFELSVVHLNDFHARFTPTSPSSGTCYDEDGSTCVGGFARLYTATKRLVNERPNAIFLNAGDNFQGTLWYTLYGWNVTGTFMNMLPHDAMTLGNHEFDNGIAGVVPFMKMMNTTIVVANVDDSEEPDFQGLYQKSTIIERNGTRIGVIGVMLSTTNTLSSTEKLKFLDEVESVNAEAEVLKAQGIGIIIVLSHSGLDVDRILAANCPNVDLIVGGHTHSFLYSGTPPDIEDVPEDVYPVVVNQANTTRTVLVVQAYAYTKYLGNISLWFDADGEIVSWQGSPILLDSSWEEDPDVLAALAPWRAEIDAQGNRPVGSTKVILQNNCRLGECNFGNLITDAMVDTYVDLAENSTYWTYAALACINAGGIRGGIESKNGVITYNDLAITQPFNNTWDVIELQGSDLIAVLETSVADSFNEDSFVGTGGFLLWSGLKATFNLSNSQNSRLTDLKIRCRACQVPTYEDVDPDEWYRIVLVSYLTTGGDGHTILSTKHRNRRVGTLDVDNLIKYLKKISPIMTGVEGRLTLEGKWSG